MANSTTTTNNTTLNNTISQQHQHQANNTFNFNSYENGFNGIVNDTVSSSRIADITTVSELETTSASIVNHDHHHHHHLNHTSNHHFIADADLSQLSLEIEKEGIEYKEKSRQLHQQLEAFRHEIDELKVDDNETTMDRIHREQTEQGQTKYSTIQKVKRGSTQSRVEIFEEL